MPRHIQSVIVPKDRFTLKEARDWVREHGYSAMKVDVTEDYYRFRQMTPRQTGRYRTIELPNKVMLIIHYTKE